jgi:DNA-binding GntR family transcriptional regulator
MSKRGGSIEWEVTASRSLPDIVREKIAEAIRNGHLQPGERIIEMTLAERLGVSRGSLREALKALEAQHLVETHRSRGTFVTRVTTVQMAQMTVARATLEGMAARLVSDRGDVRHLQALTRLHVGIVQAAKAGNLEHMRDLNLRFHELVVQASGNEFILRSWQSISSLVRLFFQENKAFEADLRTVLDNNKRLIAVLKGGDGHMAEHVFRTLITRTAEKQLQIPLSVSGIGLEKTEPKSPRRTVKPAAASR